MPRTYGHVVTDKRFSTNKDDFRLIAENEELGKKDLRLFIFLCAHIHSDVVTKLEPSQIGLTLSLSKGDIEKSLNNLVKAGIIEVSSDTKTKKGYIFTYTRNRYERSSLT